MHTDVRKIIVIVRCSHDMDGLPIKADAKINIVHNG